MDRFTRLLVLVSALAAVALQTDLGARAWPPLLIWTPALFVATAIVSRVAARVAYAIVLGVASIAPIVILALAHGFEPAHLAMWTAALLGLSVGRAGIGGWSLPRGWRLSLGAWAIAVAAVWPVIAWREIDFTPALLDSYHVGVTSIGIAPPIEVLWIAHVAALHLSGVLWLDALFGVWRAGDRAAFERQIAWPLAAGAMLSAGVGVYQMFGHLGELSAGTFAFEGRASGGMLDANAFGMIAALWAPVVIGLVRGRSWPARTTGGLAAVLLAAGAWASGSRSALAALVIGGLALAYGVARMRPKRALVGLAGVVAIVAIALGAARIAGRHASAVGPIPRLLAMLPSTRADAVRDIASELWNRNGYGAMATRMVGEWPLAGVGVGVFNTLVVDYAQRFLGQLPPDNAQSWPRHQLAEFGLLGSIGWMVWILLFARLLFRRGDDASRVTRSVLTGALVGLGIASLGGMPTQNDFVLLTFWTFVFWLALVGGFVPTVASKPIAVRAWIAPLALAAAFVGVTTHASVTGLRLPQRAMKADWDFEYGIAPAEHLADGTAFRWAGAHAVWVANYEHPLVRLTYWVHHPDVAAHPVHVQIRDQSRTLVDEWLHDTAPHTVYVRIDGWAEPRGEGWHLGADRLMLETWVDRTWRPSDRGATDTRELGLGVSPVAVCCLPAGAMALDSGR